ncbi:hypothetical protein N657DRAFT_640990 [Parathielavia appendiculata]|uniref:Uncharacterized protein n=1 Tax=Parathielavia appendiculata TaxID=2587402 RepID=A0AAN6Z6P7_9PEZI|nr:hypothetical protein N657DRAFT_640990 [Parathielavia appendiculata]
MLQFRGAAPQLWTWGSCQTDVTKVELWDETLIFDSLNTITAALVTPSTDTP